MPKEILTLQVGNYSNFVGTNWWNIQENSFTSSGASSSEICHNIMFREGLTLQGVQTYLPRAVCFDLKGNFESSLTGKDLYGDLKADSEPVWNGPVSVYDSNSMTKRNIEDTTVDVIDVENLKAGSTIKKRKLWSDDVLTPMHPRSVCELQDSNFNNLNGYFDGIDLVSSEDVTAEIESRIRYFCEECDFLQGFHLLVDANCGFGGVASGVVSYLEDEFQRKSVLAVPLFNLNKKDLNMSGNKLLALNTFLCMEKLMTSCQLTIPLSCFTSILPSKETASRNFQFLNFDVESPNQTARILASALDTATLMYRAQNNVMDFQEYVNVLSSYGRRVAAMSTVLPFPVYKDQSIFEAIVKLESDVQLQTLTPSCNIFHNNELARLAVLRGLPLNIQMKNFDSSLVKSKKFERFDDLLNWYLQQMSFSRSSSMLQVKNGLQLDSDFMKIFDKRVTKFGTISSMSSTTNELDIDVVPMLSAVHSSDNLDLFFKDLLNGVSNPTANKLRRQMQDYLQDDDFISSTENVKQYASCFSAEQYLI